MRLLDITLSDVQLGRNWIVTPQGESFSLDFLQREAILESAAAVTPKDQVVYSGLMVWPSGRVKALLLCKQVGEVGYGGVYWEFERGRWKVVGEEPDPHYELGGLEFIADPLDIDPSFNAPDHDYRKRHREGFVLHVGGLAFGSTQ